MRTGNLGRSTGRAITQDRKKAEVLKAFVSVFTTKTCLLESLLLETRGKNCSKELALKGSKIRQGMLKQAKYILP